MDIRRLIPAYILLVGFPLLALAGILRQGRHLAAPLAVHGNWNVEADFSPWRAVQCAGVLANNQQPQISIAQSGRDLAMTLNMPEKTALAGIIDGNTVSATSAREPQRTAAVSGSNTGCTSPQALRVQATVNQGGKLRFLTGTFQLEGCASCVPIAFSAQHVVPAGRNRD